MKIEVVSVIGANGTMGCNVSAIFASFGNAKTYMISRSIEQSKKAIQRAVKSVRADSIKANLIPADYSMLEQCVAESDLVFESVAENMEIKLDIAHKIAATAKEDAILGTGTSGLSVTALAEAYPEKLRSRFFGIHMFNPPYNLTLCELIPTAYSDVALLRELKEYLSNVLCRTVAHIKDSPAFLGNRIGFQLINRALQYAEKYKYNGGVDYIDAILGPFSGRSMAPIVTANFVGLDVHKAIVDNVFNHVPDYEHNTFLLPDYVQKLIDEGKLGRKTGGGLYKQIVYENGFKRTMVYDIVTGAYRDQIDYKFPFAETMKEAIREGNYQESIRVLIENRSVEADICLEFLLQYILYALYAAKDVGDSVHGADDVMATGFNWCPPLAMAEALSTNANLMDLIQERIDPAVLAELDVAALLKTVEPSKYDYRPYFRSI